MPLSSCLTLFVTVVFLFEGVPNRSPLELAARSGFLSSSPGRTSCGRPELSLPAGSAAAARRGCFGNPALCAQKPLAQAPSSHNTWFSTVAPPVFLAKLFASIQNPLWNELLKAAWDFSTKMGCFLIKIILKHVFLWPGRRSGKRLLPEVPAGDRAL